MVAAVECAILIQKMMAERNASLPEARRIRYRIGVNLGDVLIDGEDILGDGVNIAARLEGICEPGGVCVSRLGLRARSRPDSCCFRRSRPTKPQEHRQICSRANAFTWRHRVRNCRSAEHHGSGARAGRREPPHLSIVVLPFANIGGDPEQDYFVDGVTERPDD